MEEYNKRLISLINPILNILSDERKKYLEEELNNVMKNNQAIKLLIAYDIVNYLKMKKYSYTFRGNIDSSYIAYELGISNVDCYELNIIPEQCYGFDYSNNYSICFNVGGKVQNKVLKFIDRTYSDRLFRQYSVFPDGRVSLHMIYRLYVIDNTKEYKTKIIYQDGIGYKCLKAEDISNDDNIIKIIPIGHNQNGLIDDTLRLIKKHKNGNINYDNLNILNKSKYINQLCNYSYLNIDKLYCFEFSNDNINELIKELNPKTYNDLVKICSLYHSTCNQENILDFNNLISTRDDVYDYLINNSFNKEEAFNISEMVRKGKFKEISESLKDRLSNEFINKCNNISYLFPRGHVAAYINQDIIIMYLFDKYPNEISEAYLKQYKDFDYFNKIRFCNDYKQLSRYIEFFEKEKKLKDDIYKWKYNEIIKGLKFRMLLIEYAMSEESLLIGEYDDEYKDRNKQIEELRKNEVNKEEYLKRLRTKYVKRGIEKTYEEQYLKAEGHELDSKFFSPTSSSRLCFELFSWMAFDGNIEDIEFEYFLPGLKSVHGYVVPQPNMDVYYENENINFVESKFTEQSYNKKDDISKNYYDYYLDGNNNIGKNVLEVCNIRFDGNLIFTKHFIKLVNEILEYGEGHKLLNKKDWFDLKQEITHIFGIGQYIYKYRPTKNIKFTNLVYFFDNGVSLLAKQFKTLAVNMMNKYINELELPILFFYDFKYMQDYVHELILNRRAFASNKRIKDIFKEYKLLEV